MGIVNCASWHFFYDIDTPFEGKRAYSRRISKGIIEANPWSY
jgi:hypothetical protein